MNKNSRAVALIAVENCTYSFDKLFSYLIPTEFSEIICAGMRVLVPFGRGSVLRQGFVFDVCYSDDSVIELKEIASVLDAVPMLNNEMLKLALWIRDRCFCTYFTAAKSLLPGGMCMKTEKTYQCCTDIPPEKLDRLDETEKLIIAYLRKKKDFVRESLILKKAGLSKDSVIIKKLARDGYLIESTDAFRRVNDLSLQMICVNSEFDSEDGIVLTDKQKSVVSFLSDIGSATSKEISYFTGVSDSVIKNLINKGICTVFDAPLKREVKTSFSVSEYKKPVLSDAQKNVFNKLYNCYKMREKQSALLYGVTGSGKTSVYLELIDKVLLEDKAVIVLVPEISLTPQTFSIFSNRYGNDVAVLHSGLSIGERYDEWKRIFDGNVKVVIGTRSAVFAPIKNLGMIIIDEEQEHTYKSEMSPRYNAKEVARFRCAYNNAFLLLASATPSVETFAKAKGGQMELCELKERYGRAVLPNVFTVDMSDKSLTSGFFAISNPLAQEIEYNLEHKEQTILLVNRRGYNTFVVCSDCKKVVSCPKCSISMTYHSANNRLMCHYCGYSVPFLQNCPTCGAENIRYAGFGTQRVEQELNIRFPQARVIRMDADTTVAKNSHEKVLNAFAKGEYDILIGTQMVAKGLDFPDVTLVGITSADKELYNNDFRSSERSFDLITQVVGRAGRGKRKGRAVIQTLVPDNHIIEIASKQDYDSFYKTEISLRKALVFPPFCDLCEISFSGTSSDDVNLCAETFFNIFVKLNETEYSEQKVIVLGPMAPKVSKINDLYRMRILIKCRNSAKFRELVNRALTKIYDDRKFRNITVIADINPENLN